MTEFIYGIPNSGKSTLVYNRIKEDLSQDKDVILIVPDQEALGAEAAVSEVCRGVPTYKLRVYGFSRLANDTFRKYGGLCYDYVDKTGALLAVFLALCSVQPSLEIYGGVSVTDRSLLSALLDGIREFKRQGIDAAALDSADKTCLPPLLQKKLHDISLIYSAYDVIMKRSGEDPDDDTGRMYRILSENGGFRGSNIYIDSFISFTGMQFKTVELMMKTAESVTITLGMPRGSGSSVISPLKDTEKTLIAAAARHGEIKYTEIEGSYASKELKALEAAIRTGKTGYSGENGAIRVFRARTAYEEAETVAADIRRKLADEGCRCRDFAILTENVRGRTGIIDAALEKYGIPYFTSVRTDARQKALFRFILSALDVCSGNFRREDVSAYVKTGLLDIPDEAADVFDDYIIRRKIRGASAYSEPFYLSDSTFGLPEDENAMSRLEKINEARAVIITPLYDLYNELKNASAAQDITEALIRLLSRTGIPDTLNKKYEEARLSGEYAEAEEISQLWRLFISVTDQIRTLCRDIPMNSKTYSKLLDTVLSQTDIGKIPTSVDEVVIGESGMLRIKGVKHVYLIGANEGEFPAVPSDNGLFDDKDREYLEAAGVVLDRNSQKACERGIYDFYRCVCCAAETVTFLYCSAAVKGEEKYPSRMLTDILKAFPDIQVKDGLPIDDICTVKEAAFEYYAEDPESETGKAIREALSSDPEYENRIDLLKTPICRENDSLSKEAANMLMPETLPLSPSRLKSFAECSLSHCCQYVLRLRPSDSLEFDNREFGNFVHYILSRLADDCIRDENFINCTDKELSEKTDIYIKDYCGTILCADINTMGGRMRARLRRLRESVLKSEKDVLEEFRSGDFKPAAAEINIGEKSGIRPLLLKISDGRSVYLTGKIDRVDSFEKDGKTYIKLVDYKTGNIDFRPEKLSELEDVQLFIYMLDICNQNGKFEDPHPAALYYMETTQKPDNIEGSGDLPDHTSLKRGGVVLSEKEVVEALDKNMTSKGGAKLKAGVGRITFVSSEKLEKLFDEVKDSIISASSEMVSGKANVTAKEKKDAPCKYCRYISFCRYTEKKDKR